MITDETLFIVNLDNLRRTTLLAHLQLFFLFFRSCLFRLVFRWPLFFYTLFRFLFFKNIFLFLRLGLRLRREINVIAFLFVSTAAHLWMK